MAPDPDMPVENPALHTLRQLFLPLFAEAPDAVVICNIVGHIIVVNAKVESWFGYTPPELHGQPLTMLLPERFRSAFAHSLAGRRKNGQEFPLVVSILRDTVARAQEDAAKQRTELLVILGQLASDVLVGPWCPEA